MTTTIAREWAPDASAKIPALSLAAWSRLSAEDANKRRRLVTALERHGRELAQAKTTLAIAKGASARIAADMAVTALESRVASTLAKIARIDETTTNAHREKLEREAAASAMASTRHMLEAALLRGNLAALKTAIEAATDPAERASLENRRQQDQWHLRIVTASQ